MWFLSFNRKTPLMCIVKICILNNKYCLDIFSVSETIAHFHCIRKIELNKRFWSWNLSWKCCWKVSWKHRKLFIEILQIELIIYWELNMTQDFDVYMGIIWFVWSEIRLGISFAEFSLSLKRLTTVLDNHTITITIPATTTTNTTNLMPLLWAVPLISAEKPLLRFLFSLCKICVIIKWKKQDCVGNMFIER